MPVPASHAKSASTASASSAPLPSPAPSRPVAAPIEPARRRHAPAGHRRRASPVLGSVAAATRAATAEPDRQDFVNAVQIYPFAEGTIYHVYTAPGSVTDIALQPGETLGAVASGDTVRWVIGDTSSGAGDSKRTHILVKPFAAGLATNLVVTTDRRVYHLALTSTVKTAMAALSWTYPQDALLAVRKAAEQAEAVAPVASGLDIGRLRFDYVITGDQPDWRPLRAFDDGRQTFIEFSADIATGVAPPLFVVGDKGAAELVNYRVRGRFYVVDRLFDTAELRFGLKHQDVVRITRQPDPSSRRRVS
ncbi:P-type conjugative transfer protein TrbG [Flavisphingomonas formosensis]|uniref:P-type conjugative transfer protein TrbG n=1 Tax=Flavisphingomonas formosensis TaxID=861534 RepID=UPI0012FA38A7|nr:P-type conjugative transfer protein TrbG [Sphingomonas formosensis]